jgi:hypothetical protein
MYGCMHPCISFMLFAQKAVDMLPVLLPLLLLHTLLLLLPGAACHAAEPGWFRVCYAWTPPDSLLAAVSRITAAVKQMQQQSTGEGAYSTSRCR